MIKPVRGRMFVLALVAALVLSLVPAVPAVAVPVATTIYVNAATGSDATGDGTEAAPFKSITAGLAAAGAGTTIMVADGTYSVADTGETLPLVLDGVDGITIVGDTWATIDGAGLSNVMQVGDSIVTLENLALTGGFSSSPGGAVAAMGSDVTFVNCEVYDNKAVAGGAILAVGSVVSLQSSSLHNNGEDVGIQDAIVLPVSCQAGGAMLALDSVVTLTDSAVYSNGALYSGAGIHSMGTTLTAVGSSFFDNVTTEGQIGIGSLSKSSTSSSVWKSADGVAPLGNGPVDGGAIASFMGTVDVVDCGFMGNAAYNGSSILGADSAVSIEGGYFSGDSAADGVVYVIGGDSLMPTGIEALGIEPLPPVQPPVASIDADSSWFEYNDAMAVFVVDSAGGSLSNSVFSNNATWMGPLVGLVYTPDFVVTNITTANNQVDNAPVWDNSGTVQLTNSIIWDEGPSPFVSTKSVVKPTQIEGYASVYGCEVSYSNLMSLNSGSVTPVEVTGPGVISEDPLFVDSGADDFRLTVGSPCVDTGSDLDGAATDHDIDGVARPVDGDTADGAQWDMGAYEYTAYASGRISGQDRFATSVEIAQEHFTSADTAVLATGRAFADGLSGSGLAGAYGAPILLSDSRVLPADVAAELVRLGVSRVILLGGEDAISADVEAAVAGLGDIAIERIGGTDRYETASMIADEIEAVAGPAYLTFVARGDAFPDALAASPIAYANSAPVLLVGPDELPDTTVGYIAATSATAKTVIIGGGEAVSANVEDGIKVAADGPVSRITGEDRYDTAAQVAEWAYDWDFASFEFVGVATGADFADALSGGAAIGARGGVLLLADPDECPLVTEDVITGYAGDIGTLEVFGGPNAISDDVVDYIMGLLE